MTIIKSLTIFVLFLLINGCASAVKETDTTDTINYRSSISSSPNIIITVPAGWRAIDDNREKIFEIWLVNKDNNASICFIPIHLDKRYNDKSEDERQSLIEDLLINKKRSVSSEFEIIKINKEQKRYKLTEIKYTIDDNLQNSIIFGRGNLFYECLAYSDKNSEVSDSEMEGIFKIQSEIVIASQIK